MSPTVRDAVKLPRDDVPVVDSVPADAPSTVRCVLPCASPVTVRVLELLIVVVAVSTVRRVAEEAPARAAPASPVSPAAELAARAAVRRAVRRAVEGQRARRRDCVFTLFVVSVSNACCTSPAASLNCAERFTVIPLRVTSGHTTRPDRRIERPGAAEATAERSAERPAMAAAAVEHDAAEELVAHAAAHQAAAVERASRPPPSHRPAAGASDADAPMKLGGRARRSRRARSRARRLSADAVSAEFGELVVSVQATAASVARPATERPGKGALHEINSDDVC